MTEYTMTDTTSYENLKNIILGGKNVSAEHLTALDSEISSRNSSEDLPSLVPVVFNYAFSEDISVQKVAILLLRKLASLLEIHSDAKNDKWWPEMKTQITNSIIKMTKMVSEGPEEWCILWCTIVTLLGIDLRPSTKTVNALLKVAEKAFKTTSEKNRGLECWRKLIDNFALCPNDMNSQRRLNLLLIPLKAQNHGTLESCLSKLDTWKHLLSKLDLNNKTTTNLVVPPFLKFMFEGCEPMPPACNFLPNKCAETFKWLINMESVFQALSQEFIKSCGTCVLSLRNENPDLIIRIWSSMITGVKQMSWPDDKVLDIVNQLELLFEEIEAPALFTDILVETYNAGIPIRLLCKHYNSFISMIISSHVIYNIKENVLKTFLDIMDSMNSFVLSEGTFHLIMDRLNGLFESDMKEEIKNDLENNLRIIWTSLCDAMCKWIANGGHSNDERISEDMRLVHNVLFFGITRLHSRWNKSILRNWKLLFSESLKYSLLLSVNSEQFMVDLIEKIIKGIKEKQVSLSIVVEVSSILLEYSQSKETNSLSSLLMEIGENILSVLPGDISTGLSLLNQFLKTLLVAVRTRPLLAANIISITENLCQVKVDIPVTESKKITAKIMKTQMQIVSLKTLKTVEKSDSPLHSSSPSMTSFLHRLAKAEGNKSKTRVCSSQSLDTKPLSQPSPKATSNFFINSNSQDDYVFVPPKKTVIPLTEHQKERMATRRSDIPALYQDLSQDSQSVNLESISFSHTVAKEDCKPPTKNRSPSKSPIKHFSGIELEQSSLLKNSEVSKSPLKSSEEDAILRSPRKQSNSLSKNNGIINSPIKNANSNSIIVLCNQVGKQSDQNQSQEPYLDQINTSIIKTPSKTATANPNLENKTGYSDEMNKEELSIKVNGGNDLELIPDVKMINYQLKNGFNLKSLSENVSKTPEKLGLSQKTKVISPTKENGSNLNVSEPLQDFASSPVSTNGINETIDCCNDDVAKVMNKDKSPIGKSSVSSSVMIANINNDAKSPENNVRKASFHVESGIGATIKLESSTEQEEILNNKISPLKLKNEIEICTFKKKASTNKKSLSNSIITNSSGNETKLIGNDVRKALFETEENNDSVIDKPSTEKQEDLENKIRPNKVEHKKYSRKSLPSRFSPIKTRRISLRVRDQDGFTKTQQRGSLGNINKSFGKASPNYPKTFQLQGQQRKVAKTSPKVSKTKIKKVVKSATKQIENEESSNKTKLNSCRGHIDLLVRKQVKQSDSKHSVEKSGKCEDFSKELIKNNEENGILELNKSESATDICSKELVDCSLNSEILDNIENKLNTNQTKKLNISLNKENNKHLETIDTNNRQEILDISMDEVQIKHKNTDRDQYEGSPAIEVCTGNSDYQMECMEIRSPASVSRNLFSVNIELIKNNKKHVDGIIEQGNAIDSHMETFIDVTENSNQIDKEYLPSIELKNHKINKDVSEVVVKETFEPSLCSRFTRSSVILKSSRKLDTERPAKCNNEAVAKEITKKLGMKSPAKNNKEVINNNKKLDTESPSKCNKEVTAKDSNKKLDIESLDKCNKKVTMNEIDNKSSTKNCKVRSIFSNEHGFKENFELSNCDKKLVVCLTNLSDKICCSPMKRIQECNSSFNKDTDSRLNKKDFISPCKQEFFKLEFPKENGNVLNNKKKVNDKCNKLNETDERTIEVIISSEDIAMLDVSKCTKSKKNKNPEERFKEVSGGEEILPNSTVCDEIRINSPIDILDISKCTNKSKKNKNPEEQFKEVSGGEEILPNSTVCDEIRINSPIDILDISKCTYKSKKNKNPEENFKKVSGGEEILTNSTVCDEIRINSPLFVHTSTKSLETTPQKVSEKQAEFLIHSPSVVKIDCTPPKENTTDQHIFSKSNSPVRNSNTQNVLLSSKIINKKLTSPNLTDWLLRTPIKKSPEIDVKCIDNNDAEESLPGTATADIVHESEDLIPSSQEAVDTSMKFLRIVVEKLSEMKTRSPKKGSNSSHFERGSICNQDELLDKIDTDSLVSPKNNNTPVKKSVCRRLVVDTDKGISEKKLVFDEENSFVSSPRKIEKQIVIPVLTSDKEFDQCKELTVQCSEENSNGTHKLVVTESVVDKEALEKNVTADEAQILEDQINKSFLHRKSINRIIPPSPKKSSETEVIYSSPKSPRRRTSQLMALAFKNDSVDGTVTLTNRRLKKNHLFHPIDNNGVEHQQPESIQQPETWVCRIYSPSASPNTSILKRKAQGDVSPEPSSPVQRDKRKRVSFLDPVVSESLVFSKSEFGKGQIIRVDSKQAEARNEELDTQSQGSVNEEEPGNSQVSLFPALENCNHPISYILERDVTKQWIKEMEVNLQRLEVTTIGQLCKLSEATIERLPFPPPKVKRLCSILQEYLDEILNSPPPPKKLKTSPSKDQLEAEEYSPNSDRSEESLTDITGKVFSYFETHPGLVETLGKTLDIDIIMSMLNVAVASLKSDRNS